MASGAIGTVIGRLRERGDVRQRGRGWKCLCPAHEDNTPSLDVDVGADGRVLLCCRSRNCSAAAVAAALGLSMGDLFDGPMPDVGRVPFEDRVVATYDYRDEAGAALFQAVRLWAPPPRNKDFRQRRPDGKGGWVWDLDGVRRVLYRLPELIAAGRADVSTWVFVAEGEKDADALARVGLVATTNPMGAGKWRAEFAELLRGRRVCVLPDNDAPGRAHADAVEKSLRGVAREVVRLDLPGLPDKGDVSDWLAAGGTAADLEALAGRAGRKPVAAARPAGGAGSPPAAGEAAPWEPIVPLPGLPEVPAFPLHALPPALAAFVTDVAETTNTPPDFAASFALAVAGGSTGASRAVEVKPGHVQRSSVYLCAVAQKGSGKTPALDAVAAPLYDRQAELHRARDRKQKAWVGDITAERLAQVLHDNPRGALMIRDELAAWLMGFNQYKGGKGSDRQFYLSAWSGSPVSVDRVKDKDAEPLYIRYPCLSVVGTIQPAVFDRFRGDADDGFYDRVLFVYPDDRPLVGEQWRTIDPGNAEAWAKALAAIREVPMMRDLGSDHDRPFFYRLADGAGVAWQEWTAGVADEVNRPDFDPVLRGPAVKLAGYAARLALVVHMLRAGYGERPPEVIETQDMVNGAKLAAYFLAHARRAWAAVGLDNQHAPLQRLMRWAAERPEPTFTRRDAHRALHRVFPTSDALTKPLATLVQHGYLRYAAAPPLDAQDQAPGRPAGVVYERHPELCQRVTAVNASPQSGCGTQGENVVTR